MLAAQATLIYMTSHRAIILPLLLALAGCSDRSVPDRDAGPADAVTDAHADLTAWDQGGPGTAQLGQRCDDKAPCAAGLLCVSMGGASGFCSTACPTPGQKCAGGPSKTVPVCLLKAKNGKHYCAFLCRTATATFPCPAELSCSATPNPAGSKQFVCVP